MRIVRICNHPIHGHCYLWQYSNMRYAIGSVSTNFMNFEGYLLEEVLPLIEKKGFTLGWGKEDGVNV